MSYKFDEAAISNDNGKTFEQIKLEKLNEDIKKNEPNKNKYQNILYCPECHEPHLSIVKNDTTDDYFLRTNKNQKHSEICSYGFDSVSTKTFNDFINNRNDTEFINNKLHNIIDKLLRRNLDFNPFIIRLDGDNNIVPQNVQREEITNRRNVRRIPTKSITAPFSDDDYGVYKLFYGNVDISSHQMENKTSNETFYSLRIFKKTDSTILCSLSMSESVFLHLQQQYNLELNNRIENIYIAFAAKIKLNGIYKNGRIIHSNYCVIDRV